MSKGTKLLQPGQVVGEWTLVSYLPSERDAEGRRVKRARWMCRCSCGADKPVLAERLIETTSRNRSRSCGHPTPRTITLADQVREIVKLYGGLRTAARALDIEAGYMSRMANGKKLNPGDEVLEKLGLRRVVTYVRTEPDAPLRRVDRQAVNSVFSLGGAA